MKILLDTNVLIDFFCQREEFYQDAASIFDLACSGKIEIWISPISFVNFFYITRKEYTVEQLYEILRGLMLICNIASARLVSADCIVTRNVKDFTTASKAVMTPSQFLAAI